MWINFYTWLKYFGWFLLSPVQSGYYSCLSLNKKTITVVFRSVNSLNNVFNCGLFVLFCSDLRKYQWKCKDIPTLFVSWFSFVPDYYISERLEYIQKVVVCFWIYPRLGLNVCLSPWIHQCDFVIIKWLDVFRDDERADDDEVAVVRGVVGSERKWSLVIFRSVSMYVCTSSTFHQFYLY